MSGRSLPICAVKARAAVSEEHVRVVGAWRPHVVVVGLAEPWPGAPAAPSASAAGRPAREAGRGLDLARPRHGPSH